MDTPVFEQVSANFKATAELAEARGRKEAIEQILADLVKLKPSMKLDAVIAKWQDAK